MIKRKIYLFAGGPKIYAEESKPFYDFHFKIPLLVHSYKHVIEFFDEVNYVCNESEVDKANAIKGEYGLERMIVLASPDESSTLDKFQYLVALNSDFDDDIYFSYSDIFSGENFWNTKNDGIATILSCPIKSRFSKVLLKPFSNQVRGVTSHDSRVPSNATYIFAGLIICNPSKMTTLLQSLKADNSFLNLEADFLDFLALHKSLHNKTYYDVRFHVDSFRDLNSVAEVFL
jgi:hypothetical protein